MQELYLKVVSSGSSLAFPHPYWGPGIRDDYIFHFVISGRGYFEMGGRKHLITKGQSFLIYPGNTVSYYPDKEDPWEYICVGFGGIAFVGFPGEPFTDIGRAVKAESPFTMTVPCCNANGSEGYFPTDDALNEKGYEATSSLFLPGVAPELVRVSLKTLQELKASE